MKEHEHVATSMDEILHPGITSENIKAGFPDAPFGWTLQQAKAAAEKQSLELTPERIEVIKAMQRYFARHTSRQVNVRELHDALDEHFHKLGGLRYLYELFPGGPVAQGCELAGLKAPPGSKDQSFGSVV